MVSEELLLADEIEETPQSDLKLMLLEFLRLPGVAPLGAIQDWLMENDRQKDCDELRAILRQFCARSRNGQYNVDFEWRKAISEIEVLFWFDLHGEYPLLSHVFSMIGRSSQRELPLGSTSGLGTYMTGFSSNPFGTFQGSAVSYAANHRGTY